MLQAEYKNGNKTTSQKKPLKNDQPKNFVLFRDGWPEKSRVGEKIHDQNTLNFVELEKEREQAHGINNTTIYEPVVGTNTELWGNIYQ